MKTCSICKREKQTSEFNKKSASPDGLMASCRECNKAKYQGDRRGMHLQQRYGLTQAQYDMMLARQEGACATCGKAKAYKLHVDHCHTTGKVRGLLCAACNRAIGLLRDDPKTVSRMLDYLRG